MSSHLSPTPSNSFSFAKKNENAGSLPNISWLELCTPIGNIKRKSYIKMTDRFVTMENSSMRHCEVELKMSRARYEGDMRQREFEIVFEHEPPDIIPLNVASHRQG
ncbi:hypothetical protein E2986_13861 [Frieseomelitta varia]|uniref:Uncharacterized protein n=1 Tax=Frieseomelitta varia TaxID=561572 RepID=A0A833RKE4_9HYME|nr:hypothetical protein E2986_13861 [Frieseomelitta varia]